MKDNIILTDYDITENRGFKESLEKATNLQWKIENCKNNNLINRKIEDIKRYIKYFTFPYKIFKKRKDIDKIIAWQQFYGLVYAFYCRLFRVKKVNSLYIMTFIYKAKKNFLGKLYYRFMKYIVQSKYIDKIICFSKNECEYYADIFKVSKQKFEYVKLGVEKLPELNLKYDEDKYIILVGRSNRDYKFVLDSLKNTEYKVKIICDELKIEKKYDNIMIYNNIFGLKYYEMLSKSFCTIVALEDEKISSGQLSILHAMQYRKPVIVTYNESIKEYIENGKDGIVISKDVNQLKETLKELYKNKKLYERISNNAYSKYINEFSIEALGKRIGSIVKEEKI